MSKKFTEEQYQKIVDLQEDKFFYNILSTSNGDIGNTFWDEITKMDDVKLHRFIVTNGLYNEIAAIANPATREWAHERFVEKEKKFVWTSKKRVGSYKKRVFRMNSGMISDYISGISPAYLSSHSERLTESEIREWGYNPDMFDKTEVD